MSLADIDQCRLAMVTMERFISTDCRWERFISTDRRWRDLSRPIVDGAGYSYQRPPFSLSIWLRWLFYSAMFLALVMDMMEPIQVWDMAVDMAILQLMVVQVKQS